MFGRRDALAETGFGANGIIEMNWIMIAGTMREVGYIHSIVTVVPGDRIASRDTLRERWQCHRPQSLTGLCGALAEARAQCQNMLLSAPQSRRFRVS
jgi:hypothetical protein